MWACSGSDQIPKDWPFYEDMTIANFRERVGRLVSSQRGLEEKPATAAKIPRGWPCIEDFRIPKKITKGRAS